MNKETLQGILRMIETGSQSQLEEIRLLVVEQHEKAATSDARKDLLYAMRLLDEEIITRTILQKHKQA